jgi:hypothetical protein
LAQQLQPGQVEGGNRLFCRFLYNPECVGGPRSITVLSSQHNPSSSVEQNTRIMEAHDGFKTKLTDKSANHLTAKHGHSFGIDEPYRFYRIKSPQNIHKLARELTKLIKANSMTLWRKFLEVQSVKFF